MSPVRNQSLVRTITHVVLASALTLSVALMGSSALYGKDKKKESAVASDPTSPYKDNRKFWETLDLSKIVWPNPPAITRIKYLSFWSGEKFVEKKSEKKKASWMERVSGVATGETLETKPRWQLVVPNGVAVDSKGLVYIADSKVRAVFIVNPETGDYKMVKNGSDTHFQWPTGLAIDDSDRLFVSDSGLHHVLIFDPNHKVESAITEGLYDPGGLAIDNENRQLYVSDAEQDLVLVYDADPPYKLIRKIGKPGTKHTSTEPGEFAKPTGVALDREGNLYVSDTWNDRIEVFDPDGVFIRAFGKAGDGPGFFARPKGIAIDGDGHIWVADAMQNRVQVFTPEGQLLIWMGGFGTLPGQFQSLVNVYIDKKDRVYTTEQLAGRMQIFQYTNNVQAKAEKERRDLEAKMKSDERKAAKTSAEDAKPAGSTANR